MREQVRTLIMSTYTPLQWAGLPKRQREGKDFAATGMGIIAIANLFGLEGNPATTASVHHALGRAIYGEEYGDGESLMREQVRTLIMSTYTPLQWAGLEKKQRAGRNFADTGMGIIAIARLFGVEGDPSSRISSHHTLGQVIYGEEYGDGECLVREQVRTLIMSTYTPLQWAGLPKRQREGKDFAATGMGLKAIATLFGVEGSPLEHSSTYYSLGQAIYGDAWVEPKKADSN